MVSQAEDSFSGIWDWSCPQMAEGIVAPAIQYIYANSQDYESSQESSPANYTLCRLLLVRQRKLQSTALQARHSPAAGRQRLEIMSQKGVHA